ncbi:MAG: HlyC/CorC family transporter [Bdellovibrionales bacterium]|nr:HlyC/CorC family transporter [Bdellovibrionales bacterium]
MNVNLNLWAFIIAFIGATIGYAWSVLLSVSILRSRRSRMEEMEHTFFSSPKTAQLILDNGERYLLVAQIGKLISGLLLGMMTLRFIEPLVAVFSVGLKSPAGGPLVTAIGLFASLFLVSVIVLAAVQFAKVIAYRRPEFCLCIFGRLFVAFAALVHPLTFLVSKSVGAILRILRLKPPEERELVLSAEDISEAVQRSTEAGEIEEAERELIEGVLSFSETLVEEVMTPRADVTCVNLEDSLEDILAVFGEAGYSRVLVIGDHLDEVKGLLLAKDLVPLVGKDASHFRIEDYLRKPLYIDGSARIGKLFRQFRAQAAHFAVVLDEHGGVDGVITMEDLIEEIVGDIFDETDTPDDEVEFRETKSGDLLVEGGVTLDDLKEEHGIELPEGEYDTVAGFVIQRVGRIPEEGEEIRYNGSLVRVEEVSQNRVLRLRFREVGHHAKNGNSEHHSPKDPKKIGKQVGEPRGSSGERDFN